MCELILSSSPTHQRMQSLDSTGSSTAATTPATPTAGGFSMTSPTGPGTGSQTQQTQVQPQPQQQPSSLFLGKSGLSSPDATAATSPRPSAATTPVTMFGDTLLHHRATRQVESTMYTSVRLLRHQLISLSLNFLIKLSSFTYVITWNITIMFLLCPYKCFPN
jgi:hypothetical protein